VLYRRAGITRRLRLLCGLSRASFWGNEHEFVIHNCLYRGARLGWTRIGRSCHRRWDRRGRRINPVHVNYVVAACLPRLFCLGDEAAGTAGRIGAYFVASCTTVCTIL
jgi:hypothetical protein